MFQEFDYQQRAPGLHAARQILFGPHDELCRALGTIYGVIGIADPLVTPQQHQLTRHYEKGRRICPGSAYSRDLAEYVDFSKAPSEWLPLETQLLNRYLNIIEAVAQRMPPEDQAIVASLVENRHCIHPLPQAVIFVDDNSLVRAHTLFSTREIFLDRTLLMVEPFLVMAALFHEADHRADPNLGAPAVDLKQVQLSELNSFEKTACFYRELCNLYAEHAPTAAHFVHQCVAGEIAQCEQQANRFRIALEQSAKTDSLSIELIDLLFTPFDTGTH